MTRPQPPPLDIDAIWFKAVCNDQKLFQAMITRAETADRFITPVHSLWDGPIFKELQDWGYNDFVTSEMDRKCDFDKEHDLKRAFDEMGIDTRSSAQQGPNRCFHVEHVNGPRVERKEDGELPPPVRQKYWGPDGRAYRVSELVNHVTRMLTTAR